MQSVTCTMGFSCEMTLTGSGLQSHNRLRLTSGTCGADCSNGYETSLTALRPFQSQSGDAGSYAFGALMNVVPATYNICWASLGPTRISIEKSGVLDCNEYYFRIGSLALHGPAGLSLALNALRPTYSTGPAAGQSFNLEVLLNIDASFTAATADAMGSRVRVVHYATTCGTDGAATTTSQLRPLGAVDGGGYADQRGAAYKERVTWFNLRLLTPGLYRVCWCAGGSCSTSSEFSVDVGTFQVFGPIGLQSDPTRSRQFDCGFEDMLAEGCLIWNQSNSSADALWVRASGGTPTRFTGPSSSRTGTYYLYLGHEPTPNSSLRGARCRRVRARASRRRQRPPSEGRSCAFLD
ncbi:unnamed protein product [Polarella glacialis]|uniref:Uncharacterized protein n=1 Tax=Polarella glacialis TaxID=89957 RepID=A0A813FBE7_POLGL|nr:unnamed protein product [Polarella glacialis]CAE8719938.1 unnamed protein product [Polarella glacialis]